MSAAHTPGPWTNEGQGDITGIERNDDINGKVDVCSVYLRTAPGRHEANARLIAAAPELLEALGNLVENQNATWIASGFTDEQIQAMPYLKPARAAIAKATGASS